MIIINNTTENSIIWIKELNKKWRKEQVKQYFLRIAKKEKVLGFLKW